MVIPAPRSRGWPLLRHSGREASSSGPQLSRASCAHTASGQGSPASCCGEQVCPFQAPLRPRVVSPWSRTMTICSGFLLHPENPSVSSPSQHFLGTLLLPSLYLPEGRLAQNRPHLVTPSALHGEARPSHGLEMPTSAGQKARPCHPGEVSDLQ